ncbi:hypothetical protein GF336_04805 [Candidatus Woesearchaeota archaeon]|nr:hypothetical protein [Candidatus Woesearchaeota archaeon]
MEDKKGKSNRTLIEYYSYDTLKDIHKYILTDKPLEERTLSILNQVSLRIRESSITEIKEKSNPYDIDAFIEKLYS